MAELPWQFAKRDIKRVERDLRSLLDELQTQIDRIEKEIDNDINETSSILVSVRDMVEGVEKEIEMLKRSSGCQQARIENLEEDVFSLDEDDSQSPASGSISEELETPHFFEDEASTHGVSRVTPRMFRSWFRPRVANMAIMAIMRNHGVDLFLYTAIVSLCASGITYLVMTY